MSRTKFILLCIVAAIAFALVVGGVHKLWAWANAKSFTAGQQKSEDRIKELERENSQHKENEARLHGRIEQLEKQNTEKDAELQESAQRVAQARTETVERTRNYEAVRKTVRPEFRSNDLSARADELRADANELYPELFKQ